MTGEQFQVLLTGSEVKSLGESRWLKAHKRRIISFGIGTFVCMVLLLFLNGQVLFALWGNIASYITMGLLLGLMVSWLWWFGRNITRAGRTFLQEVTK